MKCKGLRTRCPNCKVKQVGKREETCAACGADMHCTQNAVDGYTLCKWHGGPVPSRNFYGRGVMGTGKASSFPLTRLAAKYNEQMSDGVLLSNRRTVELIDTRITQLLTRVDIDEAPDRLKDLRDKWEEYKTYSVGSPEYQQARWELDAIFDRVYHDYAAWRQIFEALDLRGKTTEREIRALKEIRAIMTAEDGYELAAKLMAAVIRVIGDDPKKIKQVQYEFARIIGESSDRTGEEDVVDVGGGESEDRGTTGPGDMDQA